MSLSRTRVDASARPVRGPLHAVPRRQRQPVTRAGRQARRRRRLVGLFRLTVFLVVIAVAVWAGVRVAHAGEDASVYTGHRYVVEAGDSLWGIAAAEYGNAIDLRRAVYEIRAANGLERSTLHPGVTLTLPYLGD